MILTCPFCLVENQEHDGTCEAHDQPESGDISICWSCRSISVFEFGPAGVALRVPTPEEVQRFKVSPMIAEVLSTMNAASRPQQAIETLLNRKKGEDRG
jgi:hypothetical protein